MSEKKEKTIFIICFHPLVSRNILSSPFFNMLTSVSGLKIVLVVQKIKKEFFERFYKRENVIVEGVDRKLNELDYLFKDFAAAAIRTRSRKIIRKMRLGHERWNSLRIFFWAPLVRSLIPFLFSVIIPKNRYSLLFDKYSPDLVFSTDVFNPMDVIFMHEAKKRGVRTLGMVRSWDNLTAKGGFRVVPDIIAVHNSIIKKEAWQIHKIPEKKIKVVGIPHYDKYRNGSPVSRADFCAKFGIPASSKFIVYAPIGNRFFSRNTFDKEMVLILSKIISKELYLIVRNPPGDPVDLEGIVSAGNIIIDIPGTKFSGRGSERVVDTEISPEDDNWLSATLMLCEVLVSGFTTLVVDAARFGKPAIVVGFDAITPIPKNESVLRHLEFNHFQPILKSGGVKIARSESELKRFVEEAVAHPELGLKERIEMAREQGFAQDGNSSARLLDVVLKQIKS